MSKKVAGTALSAAGANKGANTSTPPQININKFREECLSAHNEYRKKHTAPPIKLNEKLCKYAEEWAKTLIARNEMKHRDQKQYGENIYYASSTDPKFIPSGKDPVDEWYAEIKDFKFGEDPKNTGVGHFTQVVWEDTKEMGVGIAKKKEGQAFIIVANYSPPGNRLGEFATKVHPVGGSAGKSEVNASLGAAPVASKRPASSVSPQLNINKFREECLNAHNEYRKKHKVPPLQLSEKLCKYAEEWANTLIAKNEMKHRDQKEYGENICYAASTDPKFIPSGKEPVDQWYAEIKDFKFGQEPTSTGIGHFTQVVWEDTKEMGVGVAKKKDGQAFMVVVNYSPPGNRLGDFATKVHPTGGAVMTATVNAGAITNKGAGAAPPTSKGPASGPTPQLNINKFKEECLNAHNEYRKKHKVAPLKLSEKLCKYAEEWANSLIAKNEMKHRDQKEYGENIFFASSTDPKFIPSGKDPVDQWYAEVKDFKFGQEPKSTGIGHFTQVVWEDTKEMGVGVAKKKEGQAFMVVVNYSPPGNRLGDFATKVHPAGGGVTTATVNAGASANKGAGAAPPASKGQTSDSPPQLNIKKFREECLNAHNEYRKKHRAPRLQLSEKLCKYAEEWANTLIAKNEMKHRDQKEYGENIFYAASTDPKFIPSGKDPVDQWYAEVKDFKFGQEPKSTGIGHFTQVVWEDTKEMGVGIAKKKEGQAFMVVVNYSPPGNRLGEFATKVHPA